MSPALEHAFIHKLNKATNVCLCLVVIAGKKYIVALFVKNVPVYYHNHTAPFVSNSDLMANLIS